jgi:predicted nucleotidyltransferase
MTDFGALLSALSRNGVEFIVIGGAAAVAHGSARLTQDLDIVYSRSSENLDRLVTALAQCKPYLRGAPPGLPFIWDRTTLARGLNFTLATSLGDIDLLGEIPGGGAYQELAKDAITLKIAETSCLCLSLPQLIRAKRAAGRPRDLEALAELEAIEEEGHGIESSR